MDEKCIVLVWKWSASPIKPVKLLVRNPRWTGGGWSQGTRAAGDPICLCTSRYFVPLLPSLPGCLDGSGWQASSGTKSQCWQCWLPLEFSVPIQGQPGVLDDIGQARGPEWLKWRVDRTEPTSNAIPLFHSPCRDGTNGRNCRAAGRKTGAGPPCGLWLAGTPLLCTIVTIRMRPRMYMIQVPPGL